MFSATEKFWGILRKRCLHESIELRSVLKEEIVNNRRASSSASFRLHGREKDPCSPWIPSYSFTELLQMWNILCVRVLQKLQVPQKLSVLRLSYKVPLSCHGYVTRRVTEMAQMTL